jgi:hypothetical protein
MHAKHLLAALGVVATVGVTYVITKTARRALDEATATPAVADAPAPALERRAHEPSQPLVLPDDEANRRLLSHVHPRCYTNPQPSGRVSLERGLEHSRCGSTV